MAVVVRRARLPEERFALQRLHDSFLEVKYDARFYDALENDRSCVALVACVDDALVGVATARDWDDDIGPGWARRQLAFWIWGARAGYIMTLGVLPAFRGRGAGSALLRELCFILATTGCSEVQLHCLASNSLGQALYTSHGFSVTDALTGYYHFDGRSHDAVAMSARLESAGLPRSLGRHATRAPSASRESSVAPAETLTLSGTDGLGTAGGCADTVLAMSPGAPLEAARCGGRPGGSPLRPASNHVQLQLLQQDAAAPEPQDRPMAGWFSGLFYLLQWSAGGVQAPPPGT